MVVDIADLVIAAGGVVVGILAFLAGRRTLKPPRREFFFKCEGPHPLLPANLDRNRGSIEVRYSGSEIANPHIATLILTLAGTHDIPSDHFDSGKPLEFDLGVRGFVLNQEPSNLPTDYLDGKLQIGPTLVRVGDKYSITILTTDKPSISSPSSPRPDVKVSSLDEWTQATDRLESKATTFGVVGSFSIFCFVTLGAFFLPGGFRDHETLPSTSPYPIALLSSMVLMLLSVILIPWWIKRRR